MIRPRTLDHQLRPFLGSWTLGIGSDIAHSLLEERPIAQGSRFAEVPLAPTQNLA
jgi:hypothetical protein